MIMNTIVSHARLNIYLDDPDLRTRIRIAAASGNVSLSAYCLTAIRQRLVEDGFLSEHELIKPSMRDTTQAESRAAAARALEELRRQAGPIGVPVRDLIAEGRRR